MNQDVSIKRLIHVIFLTSLLLLTRAVLSQPQIGEYTVETIPYTGQLSGFIGTCFLQDRDGFMWFGSKDGLYRYNGKDFKVYRNDPYDENSLSNDGIHYIIEDKDGIIWIATEHGLTAFNPREEKFHRYYHNPEDSLSLGSNILRYLYLDEEDKLWIAHIRGFSKFDSATGSFSNFRPPENSEFKNSRYKLAWLIAKESRHIMWINFDDMICRYDLRTGEYKMVADVPCIVKNLVLDSKGRFWMTGYSGVYQFDTDNLSFGQKLHEEENPNRLHNPMVRYFMEDDDGSIWLRTYDGLYKYSQDLELKFHWNDRSTYEDTGADKLMTRHMYKDREGILWFYSKEGICKFYETLYKFNVLATGNIMGIAGTDKNSIWFGSDGLAYQLDRNSKKLRTFHLFEPAYVHVEPDFISKTIMFQDHSGAVWAGSYSHGLFKLVETGKNELPGFDRYVHIDGDSSSLPSDAVARIFEDKSGRLWISCLNQNPCFFDRANDWMVHLVHADNSGRLLPGKLMLFHIDNNNCLWVAGDTCIYLLKPPFRRLSDHAITYNERVHFATIKVNNEIYPPLDFFCSHVDREGILWLGTQQYGLLRVDENNIRAYSTSNGLPSNTIQSILEDNAGYFWLGTKKGLSRFDPASGSFLNYTTLQGLPSNFFVLNVACQGWNGEFLFGTNAGMVSFYPDSIKTNLNPPTILITAIKINDQSIPALNGTENLRLSHNQDFISFEFAALNYIMPENNQYKYRLLGADDDWVFCGTRNYTNFAELGPGNYSFQVSGSNNDGVWNEEGATIHFRIPYPPWFRWWAYMLYGLILLLLIRWYRGFLINKEKINADLNLKEMEVNKMREMDRMKSRFIANISHEFRTPLTLILGPVEKLIKSGKDKFELSRDNAGIIYRNATRLHRLINQLLDVSKLEAGKLSLRVSEGDLIEFSRSIILSYISLAESKMINYKHSLPAVPQRVLFDSEKVEKILDNLISNAFKFTPEGGSIEVYMVYAPTHPSSTIEYIEITVADTGMGIAPDQLDKVFERFYQVSNPDTMDVEGTGIGLALVKELVEVYHGDISVSSEPGKGSTFTVKLPVSESGFESDEIAPGTINNIVSKDYSEPYDEPAAPMSKEPEQETILAAGPGKPMILVVEDNSDLRKYIAENLEVSYRLLMADNGTLGLEKAMECIPDLVISDVMMPGIDGITLCGKLKSDERTNHIPLILLTARTDRESKLDGLDTGADAYLIKPFDMEELHVRIRSLLEQRNKLREHFQSEFFSLNGSKEIPIGDPFLKRLFTIFDQHISDSNFKISQLSDELNLSRSQIFRKVESLTGSSPAELMRARRLAKAAELFRNGHDQVATVMHSVGYNHQSYFSKCFSELYGRTPSQYIREHATRK